MVSVFGRRVTFRASMPWTRFAAGDRTTLGAGATFKVLHADGTYFANMFNRNSIVLRLDLGATSVLLAADAESGLRAPASTPLGDVENGSATSSRTAFLRKVSPRLALVSAGTTLNNGGVRFPEQEVLDSLATIGAETFRTDLHDEACPETNRVGFDDTRPGGCDNYVLEVGP